MGDLAHIGLMQVEGLASGVRQAAGLCHAVAELAMYQA